MLRRGSQPAHIYRGAYKPAELYRGSVKIAGFTEQAKTAPCEWSGTYDDVVGVSAAGTGKTVRSSKNLISVYAQTAQSGYYKEYGTDFKPVAGVTYTVSCDVSGATEPFEISIGLGVKAKSYNFDVAQSGFTFTNGRVSFSATFTQAQLDLRPYFAFRVPRYGTADGNASAATVTNIMLETGDTASDYEMFVGPDTPQQLIEGEATLTGANGAGSDNSTVALPVLRQIPGTDIRDTAEYIGNGDWLITRNVYVGVADETAPFGAYLHASMPNVQGFYFSGPMAQDNWNGTGNLAVSSHFEWQNFLTDRPHFGAGDLSFRVYIFFPKEMFDGADTNN